MESYFIRLFFYIELAALALLAILSYCYLEIAGAFSRHMSVHIALMTSVAPVLAILLIQFRRPLNQFAKAGMLPLATAQQGILFSLWHLPPSVHLSMASHGGTVFMQALLLFSAIWFWYAVFTQAAQRVWPAVAALLLTGKLFCLAGVILAFAPRMLYPELVSSNAMAIGLADQHLAGLLMVTFCPLTYIAVAILLISHWFHGLSVSNIKQPSRYIIPGKMPWPGR